MPHKAVLAGDWSEYEYRKKKWGGDPAYFNCKESWEMEFLVQLISAKLLEYTAEAIRNRIEKCCKLIRDPCPREMFVEYVLQTAQN